MKIFPSITTLYEIKRNLVDTYSMGVMPQSQIQELHLNIHNMIAYLQVLVEEYEAQYPAISHRQLLHEELKKRERDIFVTEVMHKHPDEYFTDEFLTSLKCKNRIQEPPLWLRKAILALEHMGLFIKDEYDGPYRKMFMDFFEPFKRILKGEAVPKKSTFGIPLNTGILSFKF